MEPDQQDRREFEGGSGGDHPVAVSLSNEGSSEGEEKKSSRASTSSSEKGADSMELQQQVLPGDERKKRSLKKKRQEAHQTGDFVEDQDSQGRPNKKSAPSRQPPFNSGSSAGEEEGEVFETQSFTILTTVSGQMAENPHFTIEQAKAAAKREYNRQNASRSRVRRKQKVANLQTKCDKFAKRIEALTRENEVLRAQLDFFQNQQPQPQHREAEAPAPLDLTAASADPSSNMLLRQLQLQRAAGQPTSLSPDDLARALLAESGSSRQQTAHQQQRLQLQQQIQQILSTSHAAPSPYSSNISDLLQAPSASLGQQQQALALLDQQQQQSQLGLPAGLALGGTSAAAAAFAAAAAQPSCQPPPNGHLASLLSSLMGNNK